jgi:4-amino-4-deoxy-L-arabinose transferase-like glycosyltransferase
MTIGLAHQEIITFDTRFYLFAKEMWLHGISWFPTTYSKPYPDYPVTSTLLIYLSATLFGGLNKLTAVLPSAMAASLTVVTTYQIGALRDKRYGVAAALLLFLTMMFVKSARGIALDMYPTLITAACFYLIDSAALLNKPKRVWWIYPLLALGFAFRGPIGLVIPQSVISIYYLLNKDIKRFLLTGILAVGVLILCMSLLLLMAYQAGGYDFVQQVIHMEVAGRLNSSYQPLYFYFTTGMSNYALTYPLAVLSVIGIVAYRKESAVFSYLLKLTGWALIILIGMTVPGDKKIRYILPAVPAFCLLVAYIYSFPRGRYLRWLQTAMFVLWLLLPVILAMGVGALSYYQKQHDLNFGLSFVNIFSYLTMLQTLNLLIFVVLHKKQMLRQLSVLGIAALSLVICMIQVVEPIELYIDRTHDFVVQVETERLAKKAKLVFYKQRPDALPIKYVMDMPIEDTPIFIDDEKTLLQQKHVFVLINANDFNQLLPRLPKRMRVIKAGRMAHQDMVVFELN